MDAISYLELGIPAIPSFGVSPPNSRRLTQLLELGCTTVCLAYDNDEAGRLGTVNVYKYYKEWFEIKTHIKAYEVFKSCEKDCNDYLMKLKGLK